MDNKKNKIINFADFKKEDKYVVDIDFFKNVYQLTRAFKEYLIGISEYKITYFEDTILRFSNEIEYIIMVSREIANLEPEKINIIVDELTPSIEELMIKYASIMFDVLDGFYNMYFNMLEEIANSPLEESFEYAVKNMEIEERIVIFLLSSKKMLDIYMIIGLKNSKDLEDFIEDINMLKNYEYDEIASVHTKGTIRESASDKSKTLSVVFRNDFFIITDCIGLYYKIKYYIASKNATINGFILKEEVISYWDLDMEEKEFYENQEEADEGYAGFENFLAEFKAVYDVDENVKNAVLHVLDYDTAYVEFFEDCISNFKDERKMLILDILQKVLSHLPNNDERF